MRTNRISSKSTFQICRWTHKEEQTLVFADGSAAAEEAQQEEHAPHAQEDVDAGEEQGVGCYNLPEPCGVHQNPNSHSQEKGASQLMDGKGE